MGVIKILRYILFAALMCLAIFSSYIDTKYRFEKTHNIEQVIIASKDKDAIEKSIQSAVRIISTAEHNDGQAYTSTSSGTYFEHNEKKYIITSAHSLIGECHATAVMADDYIFHCHELSFIDAERDIAIMEIEEITNRNPIKISDILWSDKDAKMHTGVHQKTYYTGYPQAMGPFTFDGKIVSHSLENGMFFMNSYAWAGSSGSGVFNSEGELIGIITAVSLANTEHGIDVMEDLVIVTSITLSDLQNIL